MVFSRIHSPLCPCYASCATGCNRTPKHDGSTPMLNSWQGPLFMKCCSFIFSKHSCWLWPKSPISTLSVHSTFKIVSSSVAYCGVGFYDEDKGKVFLYISLNEGLVCNYSAPPLCQSVHSSPWRIVALKLVNWPVDHTVETVNKSY